VGNQAGRTLAGQEAMDLASSALHDGTLVIGERLNTPGTDLYGRVRGGFTGPLVHTVAEAALPGIAALRARVPSAPRSGAVEASLHADPQARARFPGEHQGTLRMSVRVTSPTDARVVRDVKRTLAYKVTQPGLPGPFSACSVIVRSPHHLLRGRGQPERSPDDPTDRQGLDVNRLIDAVNTEDVPRLIATHRDIIAKLEEGSRDAARQSQGDLTRFLGEVAAQHRQLEADPEGGGVDHTRVLSELAARTERFPEDPDRFLLASDGRPVDLASVDLQARLPEWARELEASNAQIQALSAPITADLEQRRTDAVALQRQVRLAALIRKHARLLGGFYETLNRFRAALSVVSDQRERARFDWLTRVHDLLDPLELTSPNSNTQWRSTVTLREDAVEDGAARTPEVSLVQILDRLDPIAGRLAGVVMLWNPTRPLVLRGSFRGRLTLAVSGDAVLADLTPESPGDALTVMVGGSLSLEGTSTAHVVTSGRRLTVANGARLNGSLVLSDLSLSSSGAVSGQVAADPRFIGAQRPDLRHVVLAPWDRSTTAVRE
jgi:hypothetical protein